MTSYYAEPREDIQALVRVDGCAVLDVGCGAGALSAALKRRGASHTVGIEFDPVAAAAAREILDQVIQGDITTMPLPFSAGEFDVLIFADVLEHLANPDAVLTRCLPYLAPDGQVVISVPNMRFYLVLLRLVLDRWAYTASGVRDRTHLRIFTRHSLGALLRRHQLAPERWHRNFRLFEDQSSIGALGAVATRLLRRFVAPKLAPELFTYQYVVVSRRAK